ncbi:MAG: mechanosensitive ion channel family protein [Reyranella sp.]
MIVLATILIVGHIVEASGQTPSPPLPPGMTQAQFDAMVDAISKAVADKLKKEGTIATPGPAPAPPSPAGNVVADQLAAFVDKAEHVFQGAPVLGSNLAAITSLLDESGRGGRSVRQFFLLLADAAGVSLAAEPILRKTLSVFRRRLASGTAPERGLASLVNLGLLVMLDGLGVLAVWIIVTVALGVLFPGNTGQDRLAAAVLTGLFRWRLFVLGFRVLLQPDLAAARLCNVPDRDARVMYRWLSAVVFVMILATILTGVLAAIHTPPDGVSMARVIMAPLVVVVFLWFVVQSESAVRHWCNGLIGAPRLYRFIGNHWIAVAAPFFLFMGAALIFGAVSELADVGAALRLTVGLIVGLLIFETLLGALVQRVDSALPGWTPASETAKLPDVLARCLRVAVLIGVGVALANAWAVNVLGLVDASQWNALSLEMRTAGATVFVGFVIWELLKFVTDPYVVPKAGTSTAGSGAAASPHASRLSTLVPLLRAALGIMIALVAVLIVLADLGVNITPLLAGASILGLAVSFGSQALVKDIVSGIFYLTDDAFRVGEYIECGQTRGIVEGFTLRSIRLRHPSGQLHTIPFGDLGKIANFSRDWAIVKYDFSFPRDTDIEKVRSAVDGIDNELRRDPDFGRKILEPLKTQGVVGIADNALVIQFRFAAEPGNPEVIQREVMHRLMHAFQDQDIEFGSATAVS